MKLAFLKITTLFSALILLSNCTSTVKKKSVHGEGPLIDPSQIVIDGDKSMQDKVKYGPKPSSIPIAPKIIPNGTTGSIKGITSIEPLSKVFNFGFIYLCGFRAFNK